MSQVQNVDSVKKLKAMEEKHGDNLESFLEERVSEVKKMLGVSNSNQVTKEEVLELLNDHFDRIEKVFENYTKQVQQSPTASIKEIQNELKGKIVQAFKEFKEAISKKIHGTIDNTKSFVKDKADDVSITFNNAIASRVQSLNDRVKEFSNSVDSKFKVKEKPAHEVGSNIETKSIQQPMVYNLAEFQDKVLNYFDDQIAYEANGSTSKLINLQDMYKNLATKWFDSAVDEGFEVNEEFLRNFVYVQEDRFTEDIMLELGMTDTNEVDSFQQSTVEKTEVSLEQRIIELEKQNAALKVDNQVLKREKDGLSTFFDVVQKKHPVVLQDVINTISEQAKREGVTEITFEENQLRNIDKQKVIVSSTSIDDPMVFIDFSEHESFQSNQVLPLVEANSLFAKLNKDSLIEGKQYETHFTIFYPNEEKEIGMLSPVRHDLGDGSYKDIVDQFKKDGLLSDPEMQKVFRPLLRNSKEKELSMG